MTLQGKVAIVTGAGRGLGRSTAATLARAGASLLILSRTAAELKKTAEHCRAFGAEVLVETADVSRAEEIERAVARAVTDLGRVDILVNNAAIIGPVKPLAEVSEAEWRQTLAIDLDGPVHFARAVLPHMLRERRGKIINVTSGLGEMVMPRLGPYSVAKAGLIHFTRILAAELQGFNIQVNGLDPGVMDTRMQEEIRAQGEEGLGAAGYRQFALLKEQGILKLPERVAELAAFLASEASDGITGENGTASDYVRLGYHEA